jgi:hypothetical protein
MIELEHEVGLLADGAEAAARGLALPPFRCR